MFCAVRGRDLLVWDIKAEARAICRAERIKSDEAHFIQHGTVRCKTHLCCCIITVANIFVKVNCNIKEKLTTMHFSLHIVITKGWVCHRNVQRAIHSDLFVSIRIFVCLVLGLDLKDNASAFYMCIIYIYIYDFMHCVDVAVGGFCMVRISCGVSGCFISQWLHGWNASEKSPVDTQSYNVSAVNRILQDKNNEQ